MEASKPVLRWETVMIFLGFFWTLMCGLGLMPPCPEPPAGAEIDPDG